MRKIKMVESEYIIGDAYSMKLFKKNITGDVFSYSAFSEAPSQHTVAPDIEDTFSQELSTEIYKAMIPLITIDLQSLNPSYKSKVPVVYYEKTDIEWVVSKLDENNKITEMIFYDYNGKSHDIDQLMKAYINQCTIDGETYYFEEDRETTQEDLNEYKTKNFHIILDQVIGEDESVETLGDYNNCLNKWRREFGEKNPQKDYIDITGPYAYPVQARLSYPVIETTGEPFYYVININASDLGLCNFNYYIFYNPEERMVAQLMQFT